MGITPLSAKRLAILAAMKGGATTSRLIAEAVAGGGRLGTTYGKRSGCYRAMGAELSRMKADGLVHCDVSDTNQKVWSLSYTGLHALESSL